MHSKPRTVLALVAMLFFVLPLARADDAGKRAKVDQLFVLTKVDDMMTQMISQMSAAMKRSADEQARKQQLTPEQQLDVDRFTVKVDGILKQSLSMENLKPVFLKVYMDTYTEEELDGIIAFYQSPAGKAFLAKTPQLMQRSIQLMQQQVVEVQPRIEQAQKELLDQLAKSSKP